MTDYRVTVRITNGRLWRGIGWMDSEEDLRFDLLGLAAIVVCVALTVVAVWFGCR